MVSLPGGKHEEAIVSFSHTQLFEATLFVFRRHAADYDQQSRYFLSSFFFGSSSESSSSSFSSLSGLCVEISHLNPVTYLSCIVIITWIWQLIQVLAWVGGESGPASPIPLTQCSGRIELLLLLLLATPLALLPTIVLIKVRSSCRH